MRLIFENYNFSCMVHKYYFWKSGPAIDHEKSFSKD